ncbi:hypothetical protein FOE67_19290 [Streptomyces calidiresistens]|uniref:Uncharacterized protein n=1 Tax=Streptomyces calidiresistens TaxID=1485586 RepID=A0A7W3T607_9ACTN|nr:hypothetical protein [Streptomyces calidiresistens]
MLAPVRRGPGDGHDLVTVPTRIGLEAVDLLRLGEGPGPVLYDATGETLGFLVPQGTTERWEVPGSACVPTAGPAAGGEGRPPVNGTGWLIAPERAAATTTCPDRLREALRRAGRTLAALDRCRH